MHQVIAEGNFLEGAKIKTSMEYTGERVVKERNRNSVYYVFFEHIYRYCFAGRYCRDKVVLDAGCGTGYGTYELAKSAKKVTGIDISKEAIDFCCDNYAQPDIKFLEMDIRNMQFKDQSFDCVVSFETLEHIDEQEKFLEQIKRILIPEGVLIISTPDRENYRQRFTGKNHNHFHKKELSRAEFEHLLGKYFKIDRLYGQVAISGADRDLAITAASGGRSLFKDFVREVVVKNDILCKLFILLSLKKRRYAVKHMDDNKRKYVYLIAVCINVP